MIKISFKQNQCQEWVAFEISGHAGYADRGHDIVCAAVSALALSTVNSLERLAKYRPIVDTEEALGGFLYVEMISELTDEQKTITHILLQHLWDSLNDLAIEYSKHIEIHSIK